MRNFYALAYAMNCKVVEQQLHTQWLASCIDAATDGQEPCQQMLVSSLT